MTRLATLVIPARREEATIGACLSSVAASPLPREFQWREWIVYCDSCPGTAAAVERWTGHPVTLIRGEERVGKSAALSAARRYTRVDADQDEVVVCLDGDTVLPHDALAMLLQPFLLAGAPEVVFGVPAPTGDLRRRRGSAFQMKIVAALGQLEPSTVRAFGRLYAYRLGALDNFDWDPDELDDEMLARWLSEAGVPVLSVPAEARTQPAAGWRDFYLQTYRYRQGAARTRSRTRGSSGRRRLGIMAAVTRTALADPVGAGAYLVASTVAAVTHRLEPGDLGARWDQAGSTKN